jgi:hypothetical protein
VVPPRKALTGVVIETTCVGALASIVNVAVEV